MFNQEQLDPLAFDPGQGRAGGHGPDVAGRLRAVGRAAGNGRSARGDLRQRFGPGNQPRRVGIVHGRPASRCGEGTLDAAGRALARPDPQLLPQGRRGPAAAGRHRAARHEGAAVRAGDPGQGRAVRRPGQRGAGVEEPGPGKGEGRGPRPGAPGGRGTAQAPGVALRPGDPRLARPQPSTPLPQPAEPRLAAHHPPQPEELQQRPSRRSSRRRSRSFAGGTGRTNGT